MNRLLTFLTAAVVFTTASAYASTLVYSPEIIALTVPAGEGKQALIKVDVENPKPSVYYLFYRDRVIDGNLPLSWLSVSPASSFLFSGSGSPVLLAVRVPVDTPSGVYSGTLLSRAMASHDVSLPGKGVRLDITVPAQCSGAPEVIISSVDPAILWPPDHSVTQVVVAGTVRMPEGCLLAEAGYAVDDEYGVYSGVYSLKVQADGAFTALLSLEAMRRGQDKDGRHYTVTMYGKNQAGTGTSPSQTIVVPHDQSQK